MSDTNEARLRVGKVIRDARNKSGLTQRQLGDMIGKSNNTITGWEKGINSPDVEAIELLCAVLDIPVKEMFPHCAEKDVKTMELTTIEQNLIESWRKLSEADRLKIMGMIEIKLN
ncbi:helix-turn-helix transcriptional regulator [Desulfosporosinus sp. PR]|uniref:helix-turn-helix domain-containing protein n=1 Tax=Candidatus Desulfosporosinus nitrosoreducens TaxID=3401928 RepID=UPI0027F9A761|nr:helix-turn-helix transcriptional regulator [Desulfosporosinus sp. PR]MDQ7095986.1 helix-turn-helix transcriptional regulator [Desulfosporosinus sp. PR]